jgi:hypothetical protein
MLSTPDSRSLGWRALLVAAALSGLCLQARPQEDVGSDVAGVTSEYPAAGWDVQVAADLGEKLGCVAVGDVDPSHPGNEIVALGASGKVYVISHHDGAWHHEVAAHLSGEMIQCALGDLLPDVPGQEIAVVGMAEGSESSGGEGAAHIIFRHRTGWRSQELYRSPALLHAVAIGSLDPTPGLDIMVAGFAQLAVALVNTKEGWVAEEAAELDGAGKSAVTFRGGVAIACTDGSVVKVRGTTAGWVSNVVDRNPAGRARIACDGERLLVAGDDGALVLIAGGVASLLYESSSKLRGAVIAPLGAFAGFSSFATAGYDGQVVVMRYTPYGLQPMVVATDSDRFHHLTSGELPVHATANVLVACGYSGRVLVIAGPARP